MQLAPLWAILCGGSASLIVLFGLFYLMRVLEPEDRDRFNTLSGMLPKAIARPVNAVAFVAYPPGNCRSSAQLTSKKGQR